MHVGASLMSAVTSTVCAMVLETPAPFDARYEKESSPT
jgi:hypothetical protein